MSPTGDRLATFQEALIGSGQRIAPGRRSLSLDRAVAIVLDEYGTRGISLSFDAARSIARKLLWHPLWSVLHPVRTRK
jgi:hypothetical protein